MVRVTHPPGDTPKMDSVQPRSPKTVRRVLKPPGGGSSICFGEDEPPAPKTKSVPAATTASNDSPTSDAEASSSTTDESTESSNGTANIEASSKASANADSSHISSSDSCTNNSSSNGSAEAAPPASSVHVDTITTNGAGEATGAGAATTNGTVAVADTNGSAAATVATNGNSVTAGTNGTSDNSSEKNVTSKPTSPSSASDLSSSTQSPKPSTPTPPSPGCTSPDTKDRLFGDVEATRKAPVVRPTPPNHHMRSSIFTGEDDFASGAQRSSASIVYTATRGSNEKPSDQPRQPAPIRVRQPPGGHSTKLW